MKFVEGLSLSVVGFSPMLHTADSPGRLGGVRASRSCNIWYGRQGVHGVNFPTLTKSNWKSSNFGINTKYLL